MQNLIFVESGLLEMEMLGTAMHSSLDSLTWQRGVVEVVTIQKHIQIHTQVSGNICELDTSWEHSIHFIQ
jgi:hypothetical protein